MDEAGALLGFAGVPVHDGFTPYRGCAEASHALRGAHHLRELIAATEGGQLWASGMSCPLLDANALVERAKAARAKTLAVSALAELHRSYRAAIASGYEQNPAWRRAPGRGSSAPRRRTCSCAWTVMRIRRCASPTTSATSSPGSGEELSCAAARTPR